MTVRYQKYSPTGNITVLVTTAVPRDRQPEVAAWLLKPEVAGGEQVGFVEPPTDPRCAARLQMMGGEFCGNATMALGAMLARNAGLPDGAETMLLLEVSGSANPVACRICREGEEWVGTVDMPLPERFESATLETDGGPLTAPLARMPGIAHLILPISAGLTEAELRRRLPRWNRDIGADALGALTWNAGESSIDPLVYVPSAGTLVREHGCGSGSAAVGCWLTLAAGQNAEIPVRQSGGTITVRTRFDGGAITGVTITGKVSLVAEGEAEYFP